MRCGIQWEREPRSSRLSHQGLVIKIKTKKKVLSSPRNSPENEEFAAWVLKDTQEQMCGPVGEWVSNVSYYTGWNLAFRVTTIYKIRQGRSNVMSLTSSAAMRRHGHVTTDQHSKYEVNKGGWCARTYFSLLTHNWIYCTFYIVLRTSKQENNIRKSYYIISKPSLSASSRSSWAWSSSSVTQRQCMAAFRQWRFVRWSSPSSSSSSSWWSWINSFCSSTGFGV